MALTSTTRDIFAQPGRTIGVNATLPSGYEKSTKLEDCLREAAANAAYPKYDGPPVVVCSARGNLQDVERAVDVPPGAHPGCRG